MKKIIIIALISMVGFSQTTTAPRGKMVKKPTVEKTSPVMAKQKTEVIEPIQESKVAPTPPKSPAPKVTWQETTFDFGNIEQGVPVTHDFVFTNTTAEVIIITSVKPGCGCTATNYTKTPIKPGEQGSITAKFNAAAPGPFNKNIRVELGADSLPVTLFIKGNVQAKTK